MSFSYSKDETLKAGDEDLHRFDYLLAEVKNKYSPEMRYLQQTHEKLEVVECFSSIGIHYTSLLPVKIRTKPCIMIMRRKSNAVLLKSIIYEGSAGEMDDEVIEGESMEVNALKEEEEEEVEVITVKTLMRKKLRRTTTNPKSKIKEIIEAEKLEAELESERIKEFLEQEEEAQEEIEEQDVQEEPEEESDDEDEPEDEDESDENTTDYESGESSAEQESDEVDEDTDDLHITKEGSGVKSNIKKIISQERTKYLKDELSTKSTIDLSSFCNLDEMDTKDCLKKILEEYNE